MEKGYRQIIRLSELAYFTIHSDMQSFNMSETEIINEITRNSYTKYLKVEETSRRKKINEYKTLLRNVPSIQKSSNREVLLEDISQKIVNEFYKNSKELLDYPNEKIVNIRIRNSIANLRRIDEGFKLFGNNKSAFFKDLLETYSRKPRYDRELTLFQDNYLEIIRTIRQDKGKQTNQVLSVSCNISGKEITTNIAPVKWLTASETTNPAFVGVVIDNNENHGKPLLTVLSKITKIQNTGKTSHISSSVKKKISDDLKKIEPQGAETLINSKDQITISFSYTGIQQYINDKNKKIFIDLKRLRRSKDERYIADCFCNLKLASSYLADFGPHAIVIEPNLYSTILSNQLFETSAYYFNSAHKKGFDSILIDEESYDDNFSWFIEENLSKEEWERMIDDFYDTEIVQKFRIPYDYQNAWRDYNYQKEIPAYYRFYKKAADAGIKYAYPTLGDFYFESTFVQRDLKQAAHYYTESMELLDNYQKANLGSLIINNLTNLSVEDGQVILDSLLDSKHKSLIEYRTIEGYTFYSYPCDDIYGLYTPK